MDIFTVWYHGSMTRFNWLFWFRDAITLLLHRHVIESGDFTCRLRLLPWLLLSGNFGLSLNFTLSERLSESLKSKSEVTHCTVSAVDAFMLINVMCRSVCSRRQSVWCILCMCRVRARQMRWWLWPFMTSAVIVSILLLLSVCSQFRLGAFTTLSSCNKFSSPLFPFLPNVAERRFRERCNYLQWCLGLRWFFKDSLFRPWRNAFGKTP